jgi:ArsR family transcriptional regulator
MSTTTRTVPADAEVCCTPLADAPLAESDAVSLAHTYAAVADPVRLRLLSLIAAAGEMCSCDLMAPLAKSQPTVSHHTKILADAGLISGDKRGRWVHWRIEPAQAEFVQQVLTR